MGSDPLFFLDHLVVGARTLEEGDAWIRDKLGVATLPGGKHATMGTHNRVLKLDGGRYLEVIAIDPQAPAPGRPRWFELDTPAMRERLARGPALVHWVERTDDLEAAVRGAGEPLEILSFARGPYTWRMALRADGRFPGEGSAPTWIEWEGTAHPAAALPESGCALLEFSHGKAGLAARFSTPSGPRTLP